MDSEDVSMLFGNVALTSRMDFFGEFWYNGCVYE